MQRSIFDEIFSNVRYKITTTVTHLLFKRKAFYFISRTVIYFFYKIIILISIEYEISQLKISELKKGNCKLCGLNKRLVGFFSFKAIGKFYSNYLLLYFFIYPYYTFRNKNQFKIDLKLCDIDLNNNKKINK